MKGALGLLISLKDRSEEKRGGEIGVGETGEEASKHMLAFPSW